MTSKCRCNSMSFARHVFCAVVSAGATIDPGLGQAQKQLPVEQLVFSPVGTPKLKQLRDRRAAVGERHGPGAVVEFLGRIGAEGRVDRGVEVGH